MQAQMSLMLFPIEIQEGTRWTDLPSHSKSCSTSSALCAFAYSPNHIEMQWESPNNTRVHVRTTDCTEAYC